MKVYIVVQEQVSFGISFGGGRTDRTIIKTFLSLDAAKNHLADLSENMGKDKWMHLEWSDDKTCLSYYTDDSTSFIPGAFKIYEQEVSE